MLTTTLHPRFFPLASLRALAVLSLFALGSALSLVPSPAHARQSQAANSGEPGGENDNDSDLDSRIEHAIALGLSGSAMSGALVTEMAVNRTESNISAAVRGGPVADLHEAKKRTVTARLKLELARREFAAVEKHWKAPGADKSALAAEYGHKQKILKKATDAFNHAKHIEDHKKLTLLIAEKRERELGKALSTLRLFHYSARITGTLGALGTSYSLGTLLLQAREKRRLDPPARLPQLGEIETPVHSAE